MEANGLYESYNIDLLIKLQFINDFKSKYLNILHTISLIFNTSLQ